MFLFVIIPSGQLFDEKPANYPEVPTVMPLTMDNKQHSLLTIYKRLYSLTVKKALEIFAWSFKYFPDCSF